MGGRVMKIEAQNFEPTRFLRAENKGGEFQFVPVEILPVFQRKGKISFRSFE